MNILSFDIGVGNFGVCAMTVQDHKPLQTWLENWCLAEARAVSSSVMIDRMLQRLHAWELLSTKEWQPHRIVIEQQLRGAHINLAMAYALYTWSRLTYPSVRVEFVRPSRKLTYWKTFLPDWQTLFPSDMDMNPTTYYGRKKLSVQIARTLLRDVYPNTLSEGATHPFWKEDGVCKKDDMADAFLQAFCAWD